jgi:hypothetical protein
LGKKRKSIARRVVKIESLFIGYVKNLIAQGNNQIFQVVTNFLKIIGSMVEIKPLLIEQLKFFG